MYRLAKSLVTLRDNINAAAPIRSRASDGWIGDVAHSSRVSDHNPNKDGVVTALDITNDPVHGVNGNKLAPALIKDKRVKYVIWNRMIWTSRTKAWRTYTGINPHNKHVHVSVLPQKAIYDDTTPWISDTANPPPPVAPVAPEKATIKLGAQGGDVFELQKKLGVKADGDFGPKTEAAVKKFQKANGLTPDGVVGPYTWEALDNAVA